MGSGAGRIATRSRDFVGRGADLQALCDAVDVAVGGAGSLILLGGEAGIGKTRLTQEVATYAAATAVAVRRAACWEGEGAPAYWPWIKLLRAHAADRGPEVFATELGPYANDIFKLVPDLVSPTTDAGNLEQHGEQPRFRLFDAVASVLRRAASYQPLFLVIDDLHWADVGTAMLLRFCARELRDTRVLILGAFRDLEIDPSSALGEVLASLQQDAATRVLVGLEPHDVRTLLAQAVGDVDADRLTTDVYRRSGGNPLFVRELGRLISSGPDSGASTSIPESIRAVLNRRLFRVSADAVDLLRIASAVGEEFDLDILVDASGQTREAVLDRLDGALRARLIREIPGGRPRFAFTHALVRDSLYNRLTLAERTQVHLRIGEALEGLGPDAPLAELAHHFLKATTSSGDLRGIEYAELAGRHAFEHLAYEDAAAHFTRALEGVPVGDEHTDRRAHLLLALGRARVRAADIARAREAFEQAASLARNTARADVLAQAAIGFGASLGGFEVRLTDRAQTDLLEEALGALGSEGSALRAQVMALLSVALTYSDSSERRGQLAADAAAMARRSTDPSALVMALGAYCDTISGPDQPEERLAVATEMVEASLAARDRSMELLGRRHRLVALLELADIAAVDAEIDAYDATAQAVRQPIYQWCVPMWRGMRALMHGRFDEAERLAAEAARIGARAGSENAAILSKVLHWTCLREQGRTKEVYELLLEQLHLTPGTAGESYWVGLILCGDYPGEAEASIGRLSSNDYAELPVDAVWLASMSSVAEACAVVRDVGAAEKAYTLLVPYRSRFVVDGIGTVCFGSAERYLGVLATVLGRFDNAADHFEKALGANRRAGAAALVAATRCEYGAMLVQAGDRARAELLLRQATETYRALGAHIRAEAAQALLSTPDALQSDANVFRREGEFWTMTFAGRTARLKDAKGMRDIATLISRPGREVHVADLIAATERNMTSSVHLVASDAPILDDRARVAYQERVEQLRDELEDAERFGDVVRAERAREEMDIVAGELASALGLGGRARSMTNPAERARKAVAQRVRNALRRIDREHGELGRHLDRSLRMGSFCSYAPEHPTDWEL